MIVETYIVFMETRILNMETEITSLSWKLKYCIVIVESGISHRYRGNLYRYLIFLTRIVTIVISLFLSFFIHSFIYLS